MIGFVVTANKTMMVSKNLQHINSKIVTNERNKKCVAKKMYLKRRGRKLLIN